MKRIVLIYILTAFSVSKLQATYSIDWMKMPDMLSNMGKAIALDSINNVYSATSTGSIILEKRNRFGILKWQVSSSTTVALNYEYPVQVHVDPSGNPLVVGYRHTTSSDGHVANAIIILKYDSLGNQVYKRIYNGSYSYFSNSQYWTRVTSQMDAFGNLYIGTEGTVSGHPNSGYNVIKVSPDGYLIRVSTKNFPSTSNFHYVSQIRLFGDKLGLAGVTTSPYANATTWVLDTAGNDIWSGISTGSRGMDLVIDSTGLTYMLTWITVSSFSDVALYKFDNFGNQVWLKTFDFGGSESGLKILPAPDGKMVIMSSGNSAPSGSYYSDWITFKVDSSGNQQWFDKYNEHTGNDEFPGAIALDAIGNVYVTGIGGPFPGGPNLGKRQMVTVKYSPGGIREWASPIDTLSEYMTGEGIAIGYDSSIFVMGDVKTFIVHYFDHTGNAPCSAPVNIGAMVLSDDSVRITWSPEPNAFLYHIRYKPASSLIWETISTSDTAYFLTPLFQGTLYDYSVEAVCNSGPTGYAPDQQFTSLGIGYCQSRGLDASQEWIDLVYIDNLLNSTPVSDSGYADYTSMSVDLIPGNTYDITLSAAMSTSVIHFENWKVWIDFNGNGQFTDLGEEVVSYSSSQIGWETHTFTVPGNALTGHTIMRVSMKYGNPSPTPCETFSFGEVEDYSINMLASTGLSDKTMDSPFLVYPNPAGHFLNIEGNSEQEKYSYIIADITGKMLSKGKLHSGKNQTDVSEFAQGVYLLFILGENNPTRAIKWVKD